MVDSPGLENRYSSYQGTIEGSNPSLSFCSVNLFVSFLVLPSFFVSLKRDGSARYESRARKKRIRKRKVEKKGQRNPFEV